MPCDDPAPSPMPARRRPRSQLVAPHRRRRRADPCGHGPASAGGRSAHTTLSPPRWPPPATDPHLSRALPLSARYEFSASQTLHSGGTRRPSISTSARVASIPHTFAPAAPRRFRRSLPLPQYGARLAASATVGRCGENGSYLGNRRRTRYATGPRTEPHAQAKPLHMYVAKKVEVSATKIEPQGQKD